MGMTNAIDFFGTIIDYGKRFEHGQLDRFDIAFCVVISLYIICLIPNNIFITYEEK